MEVNYHERAHRNGNEMGRSKVSKILQHTVLYRNSIDLSGKLVINVRIKEATNKRTATNFVSSNYLSRTLMIYYYMSSKSLFIKGLKSYRDNDYNDAEEYFRRALKATDSHELSNNWKSLVHIYGLSTFEVKNFIDLRVGGIIYIFPDEQNQLPLRNFYTLHSVNTILNKLFFNQFTKKKAKNDNFKAEIEFSITVETINLLNDHILFPISTEGYCPVSLNSFYLICNSHSSLFLLSDLTI
ncbi:hypothetical protein BpHYR1_000817 [Brachionus plicatilis]|uniref:Uncharacterized protein n=1 Tax=Brachionus plicatilis TaxID=10195 RepID=A0A3M7RII6_BRAPC|nr:hypothetical protein BpHYR1_000817 [Brachionus plicatilis]